MIPLKPKPLRVVIQHPVDQPIEEVKALYEVLLVPIVPKAFLLSDLRTESESLITNVYPSFKCGSHPIFAPKESKWALTFFTAYHSRLQPPADLVFFLDYDTYGTSGSRWLSHKLSNEWLAVDHLDSAGSLLVGSVVCNGGSLIEPQCSELATSWAKEKANLSALFVKFTNEPCGMAYEIFQGYEKQTDLERRAAIKPVD